MMKAQVLEAVNKLEYKDVAMPECEPGWVLVRVKAAGVCGSDIPRIFTNGTYHFPTIPGHEFSGIVSKVRDDATEKEKALLGKKVGIFPLIPCKECPNCLEKHYEMCEKYNYLGSRCDGGFAEYVAVPSWNIVELPENVSFEQAAMLEPMSVALHGVKQANVKKGDMVAIFGTGTIGMLMAQWCKSFGADVLLVGTRSEQRQMAVKLGFEEENFKITETRVCKTGNADSVDSESDVSWIMDKTGGKGADVTIECAGNANTIENSLMSVKPAGTVLFTGNPKDDILLKKNVYWRILRKQLKITGTWNSGYESNLNTFTKSDWTQAVEALPDHSIMTTEMITHRTSLENLLKALKIMRDKKEYTNKVMVIND